MLPRKSDTQVRRIKLPCFKPLDALTQKRNGHYREKNLVVNTRGTTVKIICLREAHVFQRRRIRCTLNSRVAYADSAISYLREVAFSKARS
jgi:hypothetical protein